MFNQPGEILCQCFIVRSSRRRCPTEREDEGIVATSVAECVYTLAHVVGFVTGSLYEARPHLSIQKASMPTAFNMRSDRLEWKTLVRIPLLTCRFDMLA